MNYRQTKIMPSIFTYYSNGAVRKMTERAERNGGRKQSRRGRNTQRRVLRMLL